MKNICYILLACLLVQAFADSDDDFNLTIDQINNQIVKPRKDSDCKGSFCFVGDTLFTVQSDGKRITSITLTNNDPKSYDKLVIEVCPTMNTLTLSHSNMLRLFNKPQNQCYKFTNYMVINKSLGNYFFVLNALLADQKTYQQFDLDIYLKNSGKDTPSSSNSLLIQFSLAFISLILLF